MNFPILSAITFIPLIGALFVFLTRIEKDEKNFGAIYISIFTSVVNFFITLYEGFYEAYFNRFHTRIILPYIST